MMDRTDTGDDRGGIPQAMLRIEHDGSKAFARDRFRDDSGAEHAPGAVNRFAGAQAPGEREDRHVSRFS